ncbi:MAG: hypothetical protein IPK76_03085 [Lewinellaceae bacterium]|nr:hypothetical protein [Lewinellaceae bacterium]
MSHNRGGERNTASGGYSTIGGGYFNTASGKYSMIPGGQFNLADGDNSSPQAKTPRPITTVHSFGPTILTQNLLPLMSSNSSFAPGTVWALTKITRLPHSM